MNKEPERTVEKVEEKTPICPHEWLPNGVTVRAIRCGYEWKVDHEEVVSCAICKYCGVSKFSSSYE